MTHQKYGLVRVSSKKQNEARQVKEMIKFGVPKNNIFIEKVSGKTFNRKEYKKLLDTIKSGDTLYICSVDRLGRNYDGIISEWHRLTKKLNVIVKVIDNPILNTEIAPKTLMEKYLQDMTLLTLAFQAEQDWQNIKERQKAGLAVAKEEGKHLGRPKIVRTDKEIAILQAWQNNVINLDEAMQKLGIKKSAFYKLANELRNI